MSPTDPAAAPAIDVRSLAAGYGRPDIVVELTLAAASGEVYALIGRNGSGTSTLVATLLGFRPARRGRVTLLGRDPWRERALLMREVGHVPETPDAPPDARVDRIAAFVSRLYDRWDRDAVAARFDRLGIPTSKRFGELSRGLELSVKEALVNGI